MIADLNSSMLANEMNARRHLNWEKEQQAPAVDSLLRIGHQVHHLLHNRHLQRVKLTTAGAINSNSIYLEFVALAAAAAVVRFNFCRPIDFLRNSDLCSFLSLSFAGPIPTPIPRLTFGKSTMRCDAMRLQQ